MVGIGVLLLVMALLLFTGVGSEGANAGNCAGGISSDFESTLYMQTHICHNYKDVAHIPPTHPHHRKNE